MVNNSHIDETLSRRERRKLETRQRLLEIALQLICDCGYEATTVEDITEAADVAKGTFFNYFETKEAILPALAEWRLELIKQTLLSEQGTLVSPVGRIKLILRLLAQDPLTHHLLTQRLAPAIAPHSHPMRSGHPLSLLLAEQVRQGQATGEIRADIDAIYLGGIVRAMFFQHLLMWHFGDRSRPLPESLDAAVDLLMDGAGGPGWRQTL